MRVILSGAFNPAFEALPEYLEAALRRLGHDVRLFDHRAFLIPGRVRARCAPLERFDRARLNRRFVRLVRRFRPDAIIVNQGIVLREESIEAARAAGARCVNWFSDYPAEHEEGLRAAAAYDAFFIASSWAVRLHRDAGHRQAFWLPFACDPVRHHPGDGPGGAPSDAVVFVGSYYPERHILLRFLRGLPLGIWGPGWERAASDPHLRRSLRGGALRPAAWRALYARAAVALNIHYGGLGPRHVSGDLANTRVFEILGCGAYQVVDRQRDALALFREGRHLAAFSCGDELRARVEEALADEGRRGAVAAAGRREVLGAHTYEHRARHLLDAQARDLAAPPAPVLAAGAAR